MTLAVPFYSARAVNEEVPLLPAIKRVLTSYQYVLGKEVVAFEREFANYCGVSHCVGVANGTDALELGLRACGVCSGDKVIVAANAGYYGSTAVRSIAANPVYVDIDADTLTLSVDTLRQALAGSTPRAILVTHLYGQLAEIQSIVRLAEERKIAVVEDCAQSHGAKIEGKRAGAFGTVGCFSFYPTKNLGGLGDGGAVTTNDEDISERLRQLRQYGWGTKYHTVVPGGRNSRLDEIQAAILRVKLPHLDRWNSARREIAMKYNLAFQNLPLITPSLLSEDYVAHLYVVRVEDRNPFREFLGERGVPTSIHYPIPDHLQPAFRDRPATGALRTTENACATVVTLPCFPGLTADEVDYVIRIVHRYFRRGVH